MSFMPHCGQRSARLAGHLRVHRAGEAGRRRFGDELHPALRAAVGLVADDLRVHRARVDERARRRRRRARPCPSPPRTPASCPAARRPAARAARARRPSSGSVRRTRNASASGRRRPVLGDGDVRPACRSGRACGAPVSSSPGVSNSTSTTTRSDGASTTSSTNCSRSTRPLSPPTSFIRAPGSATLEHARVGGVGQIQAHDLAGLRGQRQFGLARRPAGRCRSAPSPRRWSRRGLNGATWPSSMRTSSSVSATSRFTGAQ